MRVGTAAFRRRPYILGTEKTNYCQARPGASSPFYTKTALGEGLARRIRSRALDPHHRVAFIAPVAPQDIAIYIVGLTMAWRCHLQWVSRLSDVQNAAISEVV